MGYRNFMLAMYRQRPAAYLSVTQARRHLAGDVGALVRVHAFLEQWGLINYQAEMIKPGSNGNSQVSVEQPRALAAIAGASAVVGRMSAGMATGEVKCATCQVPCSTNYYHRADPFKKNNAGNTPATSTQSTTSSLSSMLGAVSICPLCYGEGRFPADLASADFLPIDTLAFPSASTALRSHPWSEQEMLALLEAVESCGDESVVDWEAVAVKVGRPKDQCLLAFLKLPTSEAAESSNSHVDVLKGFPYGQVENPVMSTVAFLASMVHPKVASAASKAAMSELASLGADQMDSEDSSTIPRDTLQHVAATAIAAAAARAAGLAADEHGRLTRLRDTLIDLQMQKIRIKLQLLEDLEKGLEADKKDVEQQRLQLFIDRFNLRKMMLKAQQNDLNAGKVNGPAAVAPPAGSPNLTKL